MVSYAWRKPPFGFLKINVASRFTPVEGWPPLMGNTNGTGGSIRDHEGNFISGFVSTEREEDDLLVNLRACMAGIRLAMDIQDPFDANNVINLYLEASDEQTIQAITDKYSFEDEKVRELSDKVREMLEDANERSVQLCKPQANKVAIHLAKIGFHHATGYTSFDVAPPEVMELINQDNNLDIVFNHNNNFWDEVMEQKEEWENMNENNEWMNGAWGDPTWNAAMEGGNQQPGWGNNLAWNQIGQQDDENGMIVDGEEAAAQNEELPANLPAGEEVAVVIDEGLGEEDGDF